MSAPTHTGTQTRAHGGCTLTDSILTYDNDVFCLPQARFEQYTLIVSDECVCVCVSMLLYGNSVGNVPCSYDVTDAEPIPTALSLIHI